MSTGLLSSFSASLSFILLLLVLLWVVDRRVGATSGSFRNKEHQIALKYISGESVLKLNTNNFSIPTQMSVYLRDWVQASALLPDQTLLYSHPHQVMIHGSDCTLLSSVD